MKRIERLIKSAEFSAKYRGHKLAKWERYKMSASTKCTICNAHVSVLTKPLPNQIEIGGEAVAINCK